MSRRVQSSALWSVVLLLTLPCAAQITVGDNTNLTAAGSISFGYTGGYGNLVGSNHSLDAGGRVDVRGYYYNPRFLSFDIQPYYHRSQDNSAFQSITNGSGVTGSASLFSGSRFPGTFSYSKTYDTAGQFGVPGISGITSHGNGQNFSVGWSALMPNYPTLTANYSSGSGSATVFGADTESRSNNKTLTLQSTYKLGGFMLLGQYTYLRLNANFPGLFTGGQEQDSNTTSNAINVTASHILPIHGYWTMGWNRNSYTGTYQSGAVSNENNGVTNDVNSMVTLNPTQKLSFGVGVDYNDNSYGALQQQIISAGGQPLPQFLTTAKTATINAQAGYIVFSHLGLYARVSRFEQWYADSTRGLTQFSGNAAFNFQQRLLGALTFSVGVVDTASQEGHTGASLVGNVNLMRRMNGWDVGGHFGYTQQIQTLIEVYTTSMYSYGASAKRRFSKLYWSNSFTGNHSGLQQYDGLSSGSESISTSLGFGRYGLNGQYSQSRGRSILAPGGLIEIPVGVPTAMLRQPILYNAQSYGAGASFSPFRKCIVSAHYARASSDTSGRSVAGFNSRIWNARLEYRLRKLNLEGNYTRFQQSIATGTLPAVVNTYYIRISRWFDLF